MAALAPLMALAATAAPYAAVASAGLGAVGMIQQSKAEDAAAESTALQLESRRKGELADASLKAEDRRKQADMLISKQRAIAAAGGGGTGGSAAEIMGETAARGQFQSELELWMGGERAASSQFAADTARAEAKAKRKALPYSVGSAVLSGVSQAAYGRNRAEREAPSSYTYG